MDKSAKAILKVFSNAELGKIPNIREALVLCHIVNSINSTNRSLFRIGEPGQSPSSRRDIIYGIIALAGYLYEGIERSEDILKDLVCILPANLRTECAWPRSEVHENNSFYKTILEKIRNKLSFHFSEVLSSPEWLQKVDRFPVLLGEGSGPTNCDFVYTLTDDIIHDYFVSLSPGDETSAEKLTQLAKKLNNYVTRFCRLLEQTIEYIFSAYLDVPCV